MDRAFPEVLLPGTGEVYRHMTGNRQPEKNEGLYRGSVEVETVAFAEPGKG